MKFNLFFESDELKKARSEALSRFENEEVERSHNDALDVLKRIKR